ncbi:hypothetical protein Tco_0017431 [Tanacetum coccineum]
MDHVKSISTSKANSYEIRRMGCSPYAVSGSQHISVFSETVPFPRRLQNYCCDDWRKAQDVKEPYGVSLGLGYDDLAIRKSTIWYTLKKTYVELVRAFWRLVNTLLLKNSY